MNEKDFKVELEKMVEVYIQYTKEGMLDLDDFSMFLRVWKG